jgi:microcystin-dependent protein
MALESSTYIDGLVPTNPLGSDPLADADGHLRLIKATLKATFPNISGPVTATQADLNSPFPSGGIIMWSGSIATIPSGWVLCNGDNSTPDLRDRFVVGAGLGYSVGATGGSATVALETANLPSHTHSFSATTGSAGSHTHGGSTSTANLSGDFWVGGQNNGTSGIVSLIQNGGRPGLDNASGFQQLYRINATHSHSITTDAQGAHTHSVSGTTGATGSGTAHENRPPYYALAYIMKT